MAPVKPGSKALSAFFANGAAAEVEGSLHGGPQTQEIPEHSLDAQPLHGQVPDGHAPEPVQPQRDVRRDRARAQRKRERRGHESEIGRAHV